MTPDHKSFANDVAGVQAGAAKTAAVASNDSFQRRVTEYERVYTSRSHGSLALVVLAQANLFRTLAQLEPAATQELRQVSAGPFANTGTELRRYQKTLSAGVRCARIELEFEVVQFSG